MHCGVRCLFRFSLAGGIHSCGAMWLLSASRTNVVMIFVATLRQHRTSIHFFTLFRLHLVAHIHMLLDRAPDASC